MKKYTIGITTFSKRLHFIKELIPDIRKYTDMDIIIAINGDYNLDFSEEYRLDILKLCLENFNVYPIFFPEQRGLSKLWNTLAIHSKNDWVLLLNDDVKITGPELFLKLNCDLNSHEPSLIRVNGSFSHFVINKLILEELKYFDEKLLGFGEEDGDICYRYINELNKWPVEWMGIHGIENIVSEIRDENIKRGVGKYTAFNREITFTGDNPKYIQDDENGINGMFPVKMRLVIPTLSQYPYEKFFRENKDKL
jgi:glycosyltransferase involved in cell wall biosynthesis